MGLLLTFHFVSLPRMTTIYTLEEVAKHNSVDDCWVVVDGKFMMSQVFYLNILEEKRLLLLLLVKMLLKSFMRFTIKVF